MYMLDGFLSFGVVLVILAMTVGASSWSRSTRYECFPSSFDASPTVQDFLDHAIGVWLRLVEVEHWQQIRKEEEERLALTQKLRRRELEQQQRQQARLFKKKKKKRWGKKAPVVIKDVPNHAESLLPLGTNHVPQESKKERPGNGMSLEEEELQGIISAEEKAKEEEVVLPLSWNHNRLTLCVGEKAGNE